MTKRLLQITLLGGILLGCSACVVQQPEPYASSPGFPVYSYSPGYYDYYPAPYLGGYPWFIGPDVEIGIGRGWDGGGHWGGWGGGWGRGRR